VTVTQRIIDCNSQKEVVALVDSQAKAALMSFKKNLIKEGFEGFSNQVSW
jgi:hypothetical protein